MSELNNEIEQLATSAITGSVSSDQQTLSAELREDLFSRAEQIIDSAIGKAVLSINTEQVDSNFKLGRLIVESEQKGEVRARYGKHIIIDLSKHLSNKYGKGYSIRNLKGFRKFYEIESISQNWSVRQLKRELFAETYTRLAIGKNFKQAGKQYSEHSY